MDTYLQALDLCRLITSMMRQKKKDIGEIKSNRIIQSSDC